MASWMVHLRIADTLLKELPHLCETEFIVGNIAPDSGIPNADWSSFSPSTKVSHFKGAGKKADPEAFAAKYFTAPQRASYPPPAFSFYLGYLTHLMADELWSNQIVRPTMARFPAEFDQNPDFIWTVKEDWYDLDFKFLRDNPGFAAFHIYQNALGFRNDFMEEFSLEAFDNRRAYITEFYSEEKENLDRNYPYLKEAEMDRFVAESSQIILDRLQAQFL